METKQIALSQYQQIKIALNTRLMQQGYIPVHEEPADAVYGSCYLLWSDNIEAIRFVYNGKEQWFCLEITEDLPLKPLSHWDKILLMPFDKLKANDNEHISAFLSSLK